MSSSAPPPQGVQQNAGVTPAERYLTALAYRTFHSFWRYPGLYREPGKELCDLLVVFERDIIIFSDKHCEFPDSGDIAKDWKRWFKRAIASSLKQVLGAARWFESTPHRCSWTRRPRSASHCPYRIRRMRAFIHLVLVVHRVAERRAERLVGAEV